MTFTEDEMRAAVEAEFDMRYQRDYAREISKGIMSRLAHSKIGPDVVVTYDWDDNEKIHHLASFYGETEVHPTNIMPHYPEDKVLEWLDKALASRRDLNQYVAAELEMKALMDAHKRGTP